jgi:hypothetical protein
VVAIAVGLDDQAFDGPREVAAAAADLVVGRWLREPRPARQREEHALEVAAGVVLVGCQHGDEIVEPSCAGPARSAREGFSDVVGIEAAEVLGSLDGLAQCAAFEGGGEVDDRAGWGREAEVVADEGIEGGEEHAVGRDLAVLSAVVGGRGHVDREGRTRDEAPDLCGSPVAQRGALAARQQRGHPPALASQRDVPDGIDAAEHQAQSARLDGAADHARRLSRGEQLLPADHTVLAIREAADHPVAVSGALSTHVVLKAPSDANSPPQCLAGPAARA